MKTLAGFGTFSRAELSAAAGILSYIERTQLGGERPPLDPPAREAGAGRMLIDPATRANLELARTLSGEKQGSLLATIDRTVTGGGSRLLASRLAGPLINVDAIHHRHDSVAFFLTNEIMREGLRQTLKGAPDMARALSRIALSRGGPRDVLSVAQGLSAARAVLDQTRNGEIPAEITAARASLEQAPHELGAELVAAIKEEPPLLKRDGGFIATGYNSDLDELRSLRDESRKVIAKLQADYSEELGLRSLKIKHNNVLGWFIEAPTAQTEKLTADPARFIHRQTMAGAMRFTTTELADLESKIASAGANGRWRSNSRSSNGSARQSSMQVMRSKPRPKA